MNFKISSSATGSTVTQFRNCSILRNHDIIKEDIWVRNGKIIDPEKLFFDERVYADEQVDCKGAIISPGFIDLQINGGFGHDFSYNVDKAESGIELVAKGILEHGVTSFCPTVITSPPEVYHEIIPKLHKREGGPKGATVLGIHLEGPFINAEKNGAHSTEYIQNLDKEFDSILQVYGDIDQVSIVTLAPEIIHSAPVISELVRRGITVSLGHSMANLHQGEIAVHGGATFITHLFNAMLPFHHRDPGLVGLLSSNVVPLGRTVYYGIISDGVHTHPAALRIAHRTHPKGLVLVTDAIAALGLDEGTYHLGTQAIEVRNDRAFISGTDTLCGSVAPMLHCVKFFMEATSCSMVEALEAATLHPAKAIRVDNWKGSLSFGADADMVFLSPSLELWSTWIAGQCVFQAENKPQIIACPVQK